MSNVFVRRIALAAVALPLLLGSCADDPPVPQMPETSSPTSEPTEPESSSAPQPWDEQTEDGAVAFAEHWIDLLNGARLEADFEPFRAASAPSCKTCASFLDVLQQLHAPGALYESKPWRVRQTVVTSRPKNGKAQVAVRVFAPAERVREAGESVVRPHVATTSTYEASLTWIKSGWLMQELVVLQ